MRSTAREKMGFWRIFAVCTAAFVISASLRLVEARRWDPDRYGVDGEYLLATHDAYAWVAGAVHEDMRTSAHPMSRLLGGLAALTSQPPAIIAFWLPAILAALSAVPIVLWSHHLGVSGVFSAAAGIFGSTAPAFFARTRLGYFDTDWATFLFPLLIGLLMALWVQPYLRSPKSPVGAPSRKPRISWQPVLLLIIIPLGSIWHDFISAYALAALWISLLLLILFGKRTEFPRVIPELFALILAAGASWAGSLLGALLIVFHSDFSDQLFNKRSIRLFAFALVLFLMTALTGAQFEDYLAGKVSQYFGRPIGVYPGITYPDLGASVREVQSLDLLKTMQGAAFSRWLGFIGLAGFMVALVRHPSILYLAPLLVLGLISPRVGTRFTMYASPALVLGLLAPIDRVISRWIPSDERWHRRSNVIFGILFSMLILLQYRQASLLPVETVLNREHALGLRALSGVAEPDGTAWTWWDYGYATQYFTGMPTFADGGRNTGPYLFVLGRVLGSDNLAASAGLIRYAAAHDFKPWEEWQRWDAAAVDDWFRGSDFTAITTELQSPQYLIVQWEAISYLAWIQNYGSWEFESRSGSTQFFVQRSQPRQLDLEAGLYTDRWGQEHVLASADVFDSSGSQHYEYLDHSGGLHLLIDLDSSDVFLVDSRSYRTNLVQLLLISPEKAAGMDSLELIIDRAPGARVYLVK